MHMPILQLWIFIFEANQAQINSVDNDRTRRKESEIGPMNERTERGEDEIILELYMLYFSANK